MNHMETLTELCTILKVRFLVLVTGRLEDFCVSSLKLPGFNWRSHREMRAESRTLQMEQAY